MGSASAGTGNAQPSTIENIIAALGLLTGSDSKQTAESGAKTTNVKQSTGPSVDTTNTNTTSTTSTSGRTDTQVDSGYTTTSGLQMSQAGVESILRQAMEGKNGLADVTSGQHTAGIYNSTVNQLMTDDLMSRIATDTAAKIAPTVTTVGPRTITNNIGGTTSVTSSNSNAVTNKGAVDSTSSAVTDPSTTTTTNHVNPKMTVPDALKLLAGVSLTAGATSAITDVLKGLQQQPSSGGGSSIDLSKLNPSDGTIDLSTLGQATGSVGGTVAGENAYNLATDATGGIGSLDTSALTGTITGASGLSNSVGNVPGVTSGSSSFDNALNGTTVNLGNSGVPVSIPSGETVTPITSAPNVSDIINGNSFAKQWGVGSFNTGGGDAIDAAWNAGAGATEANAAFDSFTGTADGSISSILPGEMSGIPVVGPALQLAQGNVGGAAGTVAGSVIGNAVLPGIGGVVGGALGSVVGGGGCFITTAVTKYLGKPDDCDELETLRQYRDTYMQETLERKELVSRYYATAPAIVKALDNLEDKDYYYHLMAEIITSAVAYIKEGNYSSALIEYKNLYYFARELAHG